MIEQHKNNQNTILISPIQDTYSGLSKNDFFNGLVSFNLTTGTLSYIATNKLSINGTQDGESSLVLQLASDTQAVTGDIKNIPYVSLISDGKATLNMENFSGVQSLSNTCRGILSTGHLTVTNLQNVPVIYNFSGSSDFSVEIMKFSDNLPTINHATLNIRYVTGNPKLSINYGPENLTINSEGPILNEFSLVIEGTKTLTIRGDAGLTLNSIPSTLEMIYLDKNLVNNFVVHPLPDNLSVIIVGEYSDSIISA